MESIIKFYFHDIYLGYFYREVYGFYVFVNSRDGFDTEYSLRLTLDKLTELNKEWNNHINTYSCTNQLSLW